VWMRPRGATLEPPATTLAAAVEPTPVAPPPTTTPVTATATGSIHVETTPPGAAISINGEPKGNAPLDVADLAVGNYEVRAELRGYEPTSETVAVVAGTANVPVKLGLTRVAPVTGSVEIVSEPAGAAISVDGNPAGQAPLPALRLKPGSHKVDAAKEGFEPWSGSVTVEAGKKARVLAELKAIVKATPPPTPKPDVVDTSRIYVNAPSEVDDVAKKISGPSVSYPGGAPRLKSGDSVSVSVAIIVDENGDVQDAKITESAGKTIDDAVLAAIRKWRYTPATKQGIKVKVKIGFKQTFRAG
jgi:TonB family protein